MRTPLSNSTASTRLRLDRSLVSVHPTQPRLCCLPLELAHNEPFVRIMTWRHQTKERCRKRGASRAVITGRPSCRDGSLLRG